MSPALFIGLYVLVVGGLLWLLIYRLKTRVPDATRMAAWAKKNAVVIVSAKRRWILTGPYWLYRWPVVYRIRVCDAAGKERDGWLCIEAPPYGVDMEVKWSR